MLCIRGLFGNVTVGFRPGCFTNKYVGKNGEDTFLVPYVNPGGDKRKENGLGTKEGEVAWSFLGGRGFTGESPGGSMEQLRVVIQG